MGGRAKSALAIGVALASSALLLGGIEAACYVLNRSPWSGAGRRWRERLATHAAPTPLHRRFEAATSWDDAARPSDEPDCVVGRNRLHNAPLPHGRLRSSLRDPGGHVIYDVTYSFDRFGRRETPDQTGPRTRHLLLLGCSFVFGGGVGDRETLPYALSRLAGRYRVYNFGVPSWGPNDHLARMRSAGSGSWQGVRERSGIAVYVFIDDHVRRALGPMSHGDDAPDAHEAFADRGGVLKDLGTFGRPRFFGLHRFLKEREFSSFFGLGDPLAPRWDLRLFARILRELRDEYTGRFPGSPFYVALFPRSALGRALVPYLEAEGIRYLDYSARDLRQAGPGGPLFLAGDCHPSARAHRLLAGRLTRDLDLR